MGLRKLNKVPSEDWYLPSPNSSKNQFKSKHSHSIYHSFRYPIAAIAFLFIFSDLIVLLYSPNGSSVIHKLSLVRRQYSPTAPQQHEQQQHEQQHEHQNLATSASASQHTHGDEQQHVVSSSQVEINASHSHHPSICKHTPKKTKGDCQLVGLKRPSWACTSNKFKSKVSTFSKVYKLRKTDKKLHDLKPTDHIPLSFDNSFAVWYILKSMKPKPKSIIEFNSVNGFSTWLIKKSLPKLKKIYSFNPNQDQSHKIKFKNNVHITDKSKISDISWVSKKNFNISTTVVVLNNLNSTSSFYHIFHDAIHSGFRKFIIINNSDFQKNNDLSVKWVCEKKRRKLWKGIVPLSTGKQRKNMSWKKFHDEFQSELAKHLRFYFEFPPILPNFISHTKSFVSKYSAPSILKTMDQLKQEIPDEPITEFQSYNHIAYVETR